MTEDQVPARGPAALLRDPTFGPYFLGKLTSSCGMWIQNLGAAVLMFDLTRSALMVGMVSVLQFLPATLFALIAGALTDRFDRRRLLVIGRGISGVTVTVLAVSVLIEGTGGFGGPIGLLGFVFVAGIGWTLSNPAQQALIPALVPPRDLEPALALNAAAPSLARTVGPAIGAGLLLVGGPALAFLVAGPSHLLFAGVLLFIRGRPQERPKQRPSVFGGVRYLRDDRNAMFLVLGVAMVAIGADPVVTLTPPLAAELGRGDDVVGWLASSFGLGAVTFTLVLRSIRQRTSLRLVGVAGFWLLAVGLGVASIGGEVGVAMGGFVLAGFGFMMATVALNTRIQQRVPDELRGRVMALWGLAFLGSRPIGAIVNGGLADAFSIRLALLVLAAMMALSSLFARVRYRGTEAAA